MKEANIDSEEFQISSSNKRFRLGNTPYISTEKVKFLVFMNMDKDYLIKRGVSAHMIDSNDVNFLCGKDTMKEWKTVLDLSVKLELVGRLNDKNAMFLVEEEEYLSYVKAVTKINNVLNNKGREQMFFAFRNAAKLDKETRRLIYFIIDTCKIGKKN